METESDYDYGACPYDCNCRLFEFYGQKMAVAISRKYVCWYSKNLRDAKRFREQYTKINEYKI